ASAELTRIRKDIRLCNDKIRQKLNSYISSSTYSTYLQDSIITIRNDRYVIPLKSEYKNQIEGLIHDQSSSGATTYVEPMAVLGLNNQLKSYEIEEKFEIEKILRAFSARIHEECGGIAQTYSVLIQLDMIFAKASFSKSIKGILPILNDKHYVKIVKGRHPLIDPAKVVPIDIEIGAKFATLVITGPNTGGKTVTLKLVGLLSLMVMTGIFAPCAEGSELAIFQNIYCDIGDEQSIENNLSTFSSHIVNLVNITQHLTSNSLVLLDELGAGTDPSEGSALAIAVIEFLKENDCVTITTSHFNELKEYAFSTPTVQIASMDFNPQTFSPTYKLLVGTSGSSNAIEIATNFGLGSDIVAKAKSLLSEEKISFDKIITSAENSRRDAEKMKFEAENILLQSQKDAQESENVLKTIQQEKQKLDEKLAKATKELLSDYMDEAEELIEQIKENVKIGDEKALFEARNVKSKLSKKVFAQEKAEPVIEKLDGDIFVGDKVFIQSLNSVGEVININRKKGEFGVKVGIMTTCVKFGDCQKIKVKESAKIEKKINITKPFTNVACPSELNLLGQNLDEAIYNTDQYLSDAYLQGYSEVRIVHGKGSGVLRKGLHEYFAKNKNIKSFRIGQYGEGDSGVTIVTLK
ncbi:MAG: endonuclease MutS2, partial [Clostridia bacterium]